TGAQPRVGTFAGDARRERRGRRARILPIALRDARGIDPYLAHPIESESPESVGIDDRHAHVLERGTAPHPGLRILRRPRRSDLALLQGRAAALADHCAVA